MNPVTTAATIEDPVRAGAALVASPFLHVGPDRVYNPLGDVMIHEHERGYGELRSVMAGTLDAASLEPSIRADLLSRGWLVEREQDLSTSFHLKYVSLEAHTVCNQACYFCPVSVAPREAHFMATEQYESIVRQLKEFASTIEAVFMISYNEPTVDKRFVDQVRVIREAGLPPAVLTNGTGLTRDRVDAIVALGGLRFLSVNLSTLDRERYRHDRGGDHLARVLSNLEYAKDLPLAQQMDMVVLGTGNEHHQRDFVEIRERFAGSRFDVKSFVVNDRAGYLQIGLKARHGSRKLCGCDHVGSRPLQHLHINPHGLCILCCQDYDESVVVGDLNRNTVREVLTGPEMAQARRWVYGLDESPASFICHNCKFALTR
jgi:hypothetical protein